MAGPGDVLHIREHFSPGLEEIAAIAPQRIGLALRGRIRREYPVGARGKGLTLASSSVHGFVLLRLLASLRRWRPRSLRFGEEQAAIEDWLAALRQALPRHAGFAAALAELPRLRKGYSDTFERGRANFQRILDAHVAPCRDPDDAAAQALREAIGAALAEAEPASPGRGTAPPAERPIVWQARDNHRSTHTAIEP
jgi:indolepyruvate ferredoxin oxidoreductase beta subunit